MTIIVVIIIVPEKYNTIYRYARYYTILYRLFLRWRKKNINKKSVVEHPKINGVRIEFEQIPFCLVVRRRLQQRFRVPYEICQSRFVFGFFFRFERVLQPLIATHFGCNF